MGKAVLPQCEPAYPTVSLISSVFRGDEFLDGFLANMAALEGYGQCEHWLIRAASPGDEHARLVAHVRAHPAAVYVNLSQDPGLYEVWNLGVRLATGRYLSNANIDDRRAPGQLARLQQVLQRHPEVSVASTPLRLSSQKNSSWEQSAACPVWPAGVGEQVYGAALLFRETPQGLAPRNLPHCMPVWRRGVHAFVGEFDERRYGSSADWAFWLKAAHRGVQFHIGGQALGVY
ncbi:MAG: Glycosyl transferase family 2 [Candidatus Kentron sp. G]|nr:MAG: Glycosyl transferase family 2 [Candidatus Kentron sp. G]VFN01343.1 MAG: Glycosyl transferase family 2 [Candidatus Kentron sp. G]VFN02829.1 MAG: Glycosyl transferase family 2 [Candidatus Kentron sp. G]